MKIFDLIYHELNEEGDFETKAFETEIERADFIAMQSLVSFNRVFVFIIERESEEIFAAYVFQDFRDIEPLIRNRYVTNYLVEFESWEEAYEYALDCREKNPLCYRP